MRPHGCRNATFRNITFNKNPLVQNEVSCATGYQASSKDVPTDLEHEETGVVRHVGLGGAQQVHRPHVQVPAQAGDDYKGDNTFDCKYNQ